MTLYGCLLLLVLAAPAGGAPLPPERVQVCADRLLAGGGMPADLTDCALGEAIDRADLRSAIAPCADGAPPLSAKLWFSAKGLTRLDVIDGGTEEIARCLDAALSARLGRSTAAGGKPAEISLSLGRTRVGALSIRISADLTPPPPIRPPLTGALAATPGGQVARCPLEEGLSLCLRIALPATATPAWIAEPAPSAAIEACLAQGDGQKSKKVQRGIGACLSRLLAEPDWSVRTEAAEQLVRGGHVRERRSIGQSVVAALAQGCELPRHYKPEDAPPCAFNPPTLTAAGLGLVRLVEAQLSLDLAPPAGVIGALARHPDAAVRRRLVDAVFAKIPGKEPIEGFYALSRDPDPVVRSRALEIGCLRGDPQSLRDFRSDLMSASLGMRSALALYAQACARRARDAVSAAAAREPETALALLLLRAIPPPDWEALESAATDLFERRAFEGLDHPCPLVRHLAAGLLGRLPAIPAALLKAAIGREPDPAIRGQLEALGDPEHLPVPSTEQLWLETPDLSAGS